MAGPLQTFTVDSLRVRVYSTQDALVQNAAREVQQYLVETINAQRTVAIMLATGNSQIQFLAQLARFGGIDWKQATLFHMDEYLGLAADHPASFRRYLRERVESLVQPRVFHYLEGDALEPIDECERYSRLLRAQKLDLCCLGIGENGHLAFNDPPVADFDDKRWIKIVQLDRACREQQVREKHFPDYAAVPAYALTVTLPALCAARKMVCICPEKRKAEAVRAALRGPIDKSCPASVLRRQAQATLLLDSQSASLL